MFNVSLRGLGILNYQNKKISGEKYFLENTIKVLDSPVIFDVGASIGDYASYCLKVNHSSEIFAFEPNSKECGILKRRMSSKGVVVVNKALSNKIGTIKLYDYKHKRSICTTFF